MLSPNLPWVNIPQSSASQLSANFVVVKNQILVQNHLLKLTKKKRRKAK
jgi:hypothetical protein